MTEVQSELDEILESVQSGSRAQVQTFNAQGASRLISESLHAKADQSKDAFWTSSQCMSLLLTKMLRLGLSSDKTSLPVIEVCEALYLDQVISKQQIRRAITRLCFDFENLVELENEDGPGILAD